MAAPAMRIHTLIPEAASYGIAILVLYGLGCFALAAQVHERWLSGTSAGFLQVHAAVATVIVLWGVMVLDPMPVLGNSVGMLLLAFPVGLAVGIVARLADRAILRRLTRWQLIRRPSPRSGNMSHRPQVSNLPTSERRAEFKVAWLVVVAVLEELIYRGFLVRTAFLLPAPLLVAGAIVGIVLIFALAHLQFGWEHVMAKLPLSALAMGTVLFLGSVLPAVVAHALFNVKLAREAVERSESAAQAMGARVDGMRLLA
jgi:hypothetical protein